MLCARLTDGVYERLAAQIPALRPLLTAAATTLPMLQEDYGPCDSCDYDGY